jgi:hypothetical protein
MVYTLRFFPLQNAVCFVILTYLVPVLFTFYIQGVQIKFRCQKVKGCFYRGGEMGNLKKSSESYNKSLSVDYYCTVCRP